MNSIKMNAQDVKATLGGSKTMFREPLSFDVGKRIRSIEDNIIRVEVEGGGGVYWVSLSDFTERYAKYKIDEVLFVQEEFAYQVHNPKIFYSDSSDNDKERLKQLGYWNEASEMTEVYSRLKIRITGIKFEYLQDISEEQQTMDGLNRNNEDYVFAYEYEIV